MGGALRSSLAVTHDAPEVSAKSRAKYRGEVPVDLHRFRSLFPDRWAQLLKDHFGGDLLTIQFTFGVSERQARDWLGGKNAPSGPFAVIACAKIPGAMAYLMGAA